MHTWACPAARQIQAADANEADWHALRAAAIGGSDIPALVGAGVFSNETPWFVWLDKTGQSEPLEQTPAMERGHRLEPIVAQKFTEQEGIKCRRTGRWESRRWPVLHASPDRLTDDGGGLEAKTTTIRTMRTIEPKHGDRPDPRWVWQSQHYMTVTGRTHWWIAALIIDTWELRVWRIEHDDDMQATLVAAAGEFWRNHVDTMIPPDEDGTINLDELASRYPTDTADRREYPTGGVDAETIDGMLAGRATHKAIIGRHEAYVREIDAELKSLAADAGEVAVGGTIAYTYRAEKRSSIDQKALRRDYPHIASQYETQSTRRVLRVKRR